MAYSKKTWVDRSSQFPTRRMLTPVSGQENMYDVTRAEGTVASDGDAFDADTMNDMENRIANAFGALGTQVTYQVDGTTLIITTK